MFRLANTTLRTALRTSAFCARTGAQRSYSGNAQAKANPRKLFLAGTVAVVGLGASVPVFKQIQASQPQPDYNAIREEIAKILADDISHGPLLIRLAWHASGTYSKIDKTGGSNGATMRFPPESQNGANNGLHIARSLLEPIKAKHPEISYADLWTLAGAFVVEEMGGPKINWRPGRSDAADGTFCPPNDRLPDADKGHLDEDKETPEATARHVRDIFYRMGFNDQEITALVGAHAVGRCHVDRSGYVGPWTFAESSFTNEFFRELLENTWTKKKWNGPMQYEDPTGQLMMLPADMVFRQDKEFRKYAEIYAKDQDRFFKDFAKAFQKLLELGVPFQSSWTEWFTGPKYY